MKSFSIGNMGKRSISRKEQEDLKKKQDEEEVGKVFDNDDDSINNVTKSAHTTIHANNDDNNDMAKEMSMRNFMEGSSLLQEFRVHVAGPWDVSLA